MRHGHVQSSGSQKKLDDASAERNRKLADEKLARTLDDGGIDGERLRKRAPTLIKERGEDGLLDIDAIAETYWQIHRQPRSAWTQEVDLRPFKEPF